MPREGHVRRQEGTFVSITVIVCSSIIYQSPVPFPFEDLLSPSPTQIDFAPVN
jgi:hypothetical protein